MGEWRNLKIARTIFYVRAVGQELEVKDYDITAQSVAVALTGLNDRLEHFFSVFALLLRQGENFEELYKSAQSLSPLSQHLRSSVIKLTDNPLLLALGAFGSTSIITAVGKNPHTHPRTLSLISRHPWDSVRASSAINPSTPVKDLIRLSSDPHFMVANAAVSNPSTPLYVLEKLSKNCNQGILGGILRNPNASPELLSQFFNHDSDLIRAAVRRHANTPSGLVKKIDDLFR